MKNFITVLIATLLLVSCSKQASTKLAPNFLSCVSIEDASKDNYYRKKPFPPGHPHYIPPPDTVDNTPVETKSVLYLDFDGYNYFGNYFGGSVNVEVAGLSDAKQREVLDTAIKKFSFNKNIVVTKDEAVFLSAPKGKRMRCVVTKTNFYGNVAGVSIVNSYKWLDDTPCFVFSDLIGYGAPKIASTVCHELAHTLGLRHQQDQGCCGVSPIMYEVPYLQPYNIWWVGTNVALQFQDDILIINSNL